MHGQDLEAWLPHLFWSRHGKASPWAQLTLFCTPHLLGVYISPECCIWPPLPSQQCFLELDISSLAFLLQSSVACLRCSFQADTSTRLLQLHVPRQSVSALERFENQTCPPFGLCGSQSFRGQTLIPGSLKSCGFAQDSVLKG